MNKIRVKKKPECIYQSAHVATGNSTKSRFKVGLKAEQLPQLPRHFLILGTRIMNQTTPERERETPWGLV